MFPRSYRSTELAKELARQGHEVILYAVLGSFDYSQFEKEHSLKVRNIGKLLFATLSSDGIGRNNFFDKVLRKLFYRLFEFPDIELMFKIPGIIRREKDIDLLISVAMPFPIHWGCALAKTISPINFPKVWAADCGDPYMGDKLLGFKRLFYFSFIEKWFCGKTDYIIVPIQGAIKGYYSDFHNKIEVIPQGFPFDDLKSIEVQTPNPVPTFAYSGIFYKDFRNPTLFLEYLTTVKIDFRFILYTPNVELIKPYMIKLGRKIEVRDYVPRDQLLNALRQMDFLVNFDNGTSVHSPSKLIDYAILKKPILTISPKSLPIIHIEEFLKGDYSHQFIIMDVEQYNIVNIAKKFLQLSTRYKNEII